MHVHKSQICNVDKKGKLFFKQFLTEKDERNGAVGEIYTCSFVPQTVHTERFLPQE